MSIRQLFKDSIAYGITGYLTVVAGILLTPLYTRMFTKEDYGILDIFNTWNAFAIAIIPLGIISGIVRYFPDIKDNLYLKKQYLGTIFTTILFMSFAYFILMLLFKPFFLNYISVGSLDEIYYHSVFIVFGSLIFTYMLSMFQTKFQKYKYMTLTVINFLTLSFLGFILVYYFNMELEGFFRASSISLALTMVVGFFLIKSDLYFSFNFTIFKNIIRYTLPLVSVMLLFQATNLISRIIINEFGGLEEIGNFNIGMKISGILKIVFTAFATAWFPLAMAVKNKPDANETYMKAHNLFWVVGFLVTFGLFVFRKELIIFFAPTYFDSYELIGILGIVNFFNTSIYFYSLGLHIMQKTKTLIIAATVSILFNVTFSLLLIPHFGINGIGWGSLIGTIVWVVIQYFFSQKIYFINFNIKYVIFFTSFTFISFCLINWIDSSFVYDFFTGFGIKSILCTILSVFSIIFFKKNGYLSLSFLKKNSHD